MNNLNLIIDVFEGSGLLDLQKLKDNNIKYVLVRLGCYSRLGGLFGNRKDDLFDEQWKLLSSDPWFKKGIYIPYNPWKSIDYNVRWLKDNIPTDCKTVETDVENIRNISYSSKTYAAEYTAYLKEISKSYNVITYTGEGYLSLLDVWPEGNYSWAEYLYSLYPSQTTNMTWDKFRSIVNSYSGPTNADKCPGKILLWQCTGDKLILPGSDKGLDVYVWLGTQDELDQFFDVGSNPTPNPIPDPQPIPQSRYTGIVLSSTTPYLNIRDYPRTGNIIGLLKPNDSFEGDRLVTDSSGQDWIHITKPMVGYIASWLTKYIDNQNSNPPDTKTKPAIPGPFYILSHEEAGDGWFWPNGKLDCYPAALAASGGRGTVHLSGGVPKSLDVIPSSGFMKAFRNIMNLDQWKRTWKDQEGFHNGGDVGTVKQVEFSHNLKWVTCINPDGFYEYAVYYNNEAPPDFKANYDKYCQGIMTVDYKSGHDDTGGVINSDLLLPYFSIANDRTEKLRIDPKYLKSMLSLPVDVITKTPNSRLNVRKTASPNGEVITTLADNSKVSILELCKTDNKIWGKIGDNQWIATWLTDLNI